MTHHEARARLVHEVPVRRVPHLHGLALIHFSAEPDTGVIENNVSTDGQIAINRKIDVREAEGECP